MMTRTKQPQRAFGEIGTEESTLTTTREKLARAAVLARRAIDEADTARRSPEVDYARLQQAAQKGWTAASVAVDAFLLRRKGIRSSGTNRRLDEMADLAAADRRLASLERDYSAFLGVLHVACGYEGSCSAKVVPRRLHDVGKFVEAIAKLCRQP